MAKKIIRDIPVKGKKVLMRVDFNVPLSKNGNITSATRIRAALPTIKYVLDNGGSVILMSHLGRPEGKRDDKFSLLPVATRLSRLLRKEVIFCTDCIGTEVKKKAAALNPGQVMLLENLRFHKAEEIKDKKADEDSALKEAKINFAQQIAGLADFYVNDAFGTSHRDNASMLTVPEIMKTQNKPCVMGFLMEKELRYLGKALENPQEPFVVILGGAKISDKLGVIENLIPKANKILIGGAMAYTLIKAQGGKIGNSLCQNDFLDKARELLTKASQQGCEIFLPVDHVVAKKTKSNNSKVVLGDIPDGLMGVDIGPETRGLFAKHMFTAKTIVWNGPMGIFELKRFSKGTNLVAERLKASTSDGAITIVGGGDSVAAIEKLKLQTRVSHVSTGGGASLEFMEGKKFKCLEVLDNAA